MFEDHFLYGKTIFLCGVTVFPSANLFLLRVTRLGMAKLVVSTALALLVGNEYEDDADRDSDDSDEEEEEDVDEVLDEHVSDEWSFFLDAEPLLLVLACLLVATFEFCVVLALAWQPLVDVLVVGVALVLERASRLHANDAEFLSVLISSKNNCLGF